ncbi:hypothetical protein [Gilvibacter sediminis]|uniref:hypothetical protein n=1 Tax=Gilvibacter sediminis TaxID=379071 RepID=UPI002350EC9A|nr:hypothetical protein [Gilvibacter sediminis]MDC7997154.1 hypothetical protein [Gilvibacter sediminis]
MKLEKILDRLGSLDKNAFIKVIDNIISKQPKNIKKIEKILSSSDKGLKSVDSRNIAEIFELTYDEFGAHIKAEFQNISSQLDILIDIIIRDGNCIMKQDWFSRLYDNEIKNLQKKTKLLSSEIINPKSDISESRKRDYSIYSACLKTAYYNDIANNREAKITDDETSILLTLSDKLGLSQEEIKLINYSILKINKVDIQEVIKNLRILGVLFYSNKENTIYVVDEMVRLLRSIRNKEVAEKFYRRTLKLLREPVINKIARSHNIDRNLNKAQKIEGIIQNGVPFRNMLLTEIHKDSDTLTERKKSLNTLCEKGLLINNLKGATLEDKIDSLINHFDEVEKDERVGISFDGYEKLLLELDETLPKLNEQIRGQFQFQDEVVLKAEYLLDHNIKPRDILDLLDKSDLSKFIKSNGIKQRGDDILNVLEHYKDVENMYIENYENVAYRNLNSLKENGLIIKESELGIKFEELTKIIFKSLGFNVDDNLKKNLSTRKDIMDIVLNLENDEIIIVECKTSKERGYNKFSSVSRQLKAYQKLAEDNNLRIAKILLVAPEFSDDFVTDCEMDTEMNLSLVTASTLGKINEAFKDSKYESFPHVLFRDIVLNEDRILKAISK